MSAQVTQGGDRGYNAELDHEQEPDSLAHSGNVASARLHIIIPVLNEAAALRVVLPRLSELMSAVVIVDNGSTDESAEVARVAGARVVTEAKRGYGAACLAGIAALIDPEADDIVLFMDGDASDDVADLPALLEPILENTADLVIGSRTLGRRERGALAAHAQFGNWLATTLIEKRTGMRYSDLGPLRAVRYGALRNLDMRDTGFGWTVEMQLKAVQRGLRIREVPVHYRRRIGRSKISGTLSGSVRAGYTILRTIMQHGR